MFDQFSLQVHENASQNPQIFYLATDNFAMLKLLLKIN